MIIQLILQPIIKSGLDSLWSMFFIIQLTKVIPMLDFYMPAEVEMYYGEVRKTIDFEILSPDGLIAALSDGKHNMTTLMDLYMNDAESSEN